MDRITLQNYRCFGSEEQSARLAPLTLLVGPNSTGKTSFLALIRALWDVAFREVVPNFREHPYDLGSWDDIVYRRGRREKSADEFAGGFDFHTATDQFDGNIGFSAAFSNLRSAPYPATRSYYRADYSFTARDIEPGSETQLVTRIGRNGRISNLESRFSGFAALQFLAFESEPVDLAGVEDSTTRDDVVTAGLNRLFDTVRLFPRSVAARPFAGAPIGSRPQRTFDPALIAQDAGGDYIPSYLANLYRRNADEWRSLKDALEKFGTASELFDEIHVRSLGNADGDPFQLQVRKHSGPISRRRKGPWRNLIDVGYGVSQALPVLTELLRPDNPKMFLLQQPEVHLHPQAQAALGTLFCDVAAGGRQLIIETHSDYIIDRVRMDVRDGTTGLKPEDVSILYFEPGERAVKIHSIRLDKMGNVLDAPPSYGKFFMDEVNRSIGLVKPDVRNR